MSSSDVDVVDNVCIVVLELLSRRPSLIISNLFLVSRRLSYHPSSIHDNLIIDNEEEIINYHRLTICTGNITLSIPFSTHETTTLKSK